MISVVTIRIAVTVVSGAINVPHASAMDVPITKETLTLSVETGITILALLFT